MVKPNIRWIDMKEIMNPTKEQPIQQDQQVQPQVQPVQPIVQSVQPTMQKIIHSVEPIERQRIKAEEINLSYPEIEKPEEKPEEPEETYTVNNRLEEITAPYRYKLEQMRQSKIQPVRKQRKFNF